MRRVLAIGGSDSSGGAGIQADVKTLHSMGVHASTVVTAVTAQNSLAVRGVWEVPVDAVELQLQAVLEDLGADVVKTGMLPAPCVGAVLAAIGGRPLVVDPVGLSSSGQRLADPVALRPLLHVATVVTPNLAEVEALTGLVVSGPDDLFAAAEAVHALGPRWVLITGGHLHGEPLDLLYDGTTAHALRGTRVQTPHGHGSGCTLASALAGYLALGEPVPVAAQHAKELVTRALQQAYPLGAGPGPVAQR